MFAHGDRDQTAPHFDGLLTILFVLLFAALTICGCTRKPSAVSVPAVALLRSNQEAKHLYDIEPFKQEHGQLRTEGNQSVWEALTSSGGNDVTSKVTFDQHGTVIRVDVKMLTHPRPEPPTNLNNLQRLPPRDRQLDKHPPEVIPK
jgi:hypothetical protein